MSVFAAIDFETADCHRDSACAVGLVRVERGEIVARRRSILRPPRRSTRFAHVHRIEPDEFSAAPTFLEVWPIFEPLLFGAEFVAAHNAAFDRAVLLASCGRARLRPPRVQFLCTRALARAKLGLAQSSLEDVCAHLGIPLRAHHDPLVDAEAAARIGIALRPLPDASPPTSMRT